MFTPVTTISLIFSSTLGYFLTGGLKNNNYNAQAENGRAAPSRTPRLNDKTTIGSSWTRPTLRSAPYEWSLHEQNSPCRRRSSVVDSRPRRTPTPCPYSLLLAAARWSTERCWASSIRHPGPPPESLIFSTHRCTHHRNTYRIKSSVEASRNDHVPRYYGIVTNRHRYLIHIRLIPSTSELVAP